MELFQRTTNVEHKLTSCNYSQCYICKRVSLDFDILNIIKQRERSDVSLLSYRIGKRSLDCSYSYKYTEDKSLKKESKYIDKATGQSYLWSVCNCEIVAHPDCFLQSVRLNFNYRCCVCKEYFKLGYKHTTMKNGTKIDTRKLFLFIFLLIALFTTSLVLLQEITIIIALLIHIQSLLFLLDYLVLFFFYCLFSIQGFYFIFLLNLIITRV